MKHNLDQRSEEWKEFRKDKIGSSECPIIMGQSPFASPIDLWKKRVADVETEINHHMQRGIELEPLALQLFNKTSGYNCSPMVFTHDKYPWMMASVDGFDEDKRVLVEIKCPEREEVKLSNYYLYQLYHQMIVLDIDSCFIFFYWESGKFDVHSIHLDKRVIIEIIQEEKRFLDCINNLVNPHEGKMMSSPEWKDAVDKYKRVKQQIDLLTDDLNETKKEIVKIAQEREVECQDVRLCKVKKSGSIEYSKIPELKDVNLELYRRPSFEYWQLFDKNHKRA